MRTWAIVVAALCLIAPRGILQADPVFHAVDFSAFHMSRLQGLDAAYPEGDVALGGVPFSIPAGGYNFWYAVGYDPVTIEIPVGLFGVTEVHTLINTRWGWSSQCYGWLEFFGADGAYYKKDLITCEDIRDWNCMGCFAVNGTTTVNVVSVSGGQHVLDKQQVILPSGFRTQILNTIRVTDTGWENLQRLMLAGLTVCTETDTAAPDTAIAIGPAEGTATNLLPVVFQWTGTDDATPTGDLVYSYRIDSGDWTEYTSVTSTFYAQLADGPHTFQVKAKDQAGNEDPTPAARTFTVDTTAPTVISTSPANGATRVPINTVITATFSEAMDPATINASTFVVVDFAGTPVAGSVVYDTPSHTGTFAPSLPLASSTDHTATLTTGARDLAGNPLATDQVWSFSTAPEDSQRTAWTLVGDWHESTADDGLWAYGWMSPSLVWTTLPDHTNYDFWNRGPAWYVYNPEFGPTSQAPVIFKSVDCWNWDVPTGLVGGHTPLADWPNEGDRSYSAVRWSAPRGMTIDVSGEFWNAYALDDRPQVVALFVKGTALIDDVALPPHSQRGSADPYTLAEAIAAGGRIVTDLERIQMSQGESVVLAMRRAPGAIGCPFGTDLRIAASDTEAPTVVSTTPANGATGVPIDTVITATFSKAMDPATITTSTFVLKDGGNNAVPGTVSYDAGTKTATLTPSAPLAYLSDYTATVTTGVKDVAGNQMGAEVAWQFISETAIWDATAGFSASANPNGVWSSGWTATLGSTFTLYTRMEDISGLIIWNSPAIGIDPNFGKNTSAATMYGIPPGMINLHPGPQNQFSVLRWTAPATGAYHVAVQFFAGNFGETDAYVLSNGGSLFSAPTTSTDPSWSGTIALSQGDSVDFAVGSTGIYWGDSTPLTVVVTQEPDGTAPTIPLTDPANGATGVPINAVITATFSEPMDPATISASTFFVKDSGGNPVAGTAAYDAPTKTATFAPSTALAYKSTYSATVTTGVTDVAGNHMASGFIWSFTTNKRVYVKNDAPGPAHDGQTWDTAFLTVQEGLNAAVSGTEVWVAKGTYVERITLNDAVGLYGGFVGNEDDRSERPAFPRPDPDPNETVMDGDLGGSVVTCPPGVTESTPVDGLTVLGYGTNGWGVYADHSSLGLRNCTITGNSAISGGGGVFCSYGSVQVLNSTIADSPGSGIWSPSSIVDIRDSRVERNAGYGVGSGYDGSTITAINCVISHNGQGALCPGPTGSVTARGCTVSANGWGIYGGYATTVVVEDSLVEGNLNTGVGEVNRGSWLPSVTVRRCVIRGNTLAGIRANTATVDNSIITANGQEGVYAQAGCDAVSCTIAGNGMAGISAGGGSAFSSIVVFNQAGIAGGSLSLRCNCVYGNTAYNYSGLSPGLGDISVDPLFVDRDNGDYHLRYGSLCIDAGYDDAVQPDWLDIDGQPRKMGIHVDIGADEVVPDTDYPETQITSGPAQGSTACSLPVTFVWTGWDSTTSLALLQYSWRIDSGDWSDWSGATSHEFASLADGSHTFEVKAKDETGNEDPTPAVRNLAVDTTPPVISNISATTTAQTATITWNTDEPSDSQVEYGATPDLGSSTPLQSQLVASHSVTISGLAPDTTYHYKVKSRDVCGRLSEQSGDPFTTAPAPDLRVTAITAPAGIWSGKPFDVAWTVTNAGLAAAAGTWVDRVYLSNDDQAGGDEFLGELSYSGGLNPAGSVNQSKIVTVTRSQIAEGQDYHIVVVTDATNTVFEGPGESNNALVDDQPLTAHLSAIPDLQIKTAVETGYLGDNVYNRDAVGQTKAQRSASGEPVVYHVKLQNDEAGPATIAVAGSAGGAGWTVTYYDSLEGGSDITSEVTGAGWTIDLAGPDAFKEFRVEAVPDGGLGVGAARDVVITASCASGAQNSDAVKATSCTTALCSGLRGDYCSGKTFNTLALTRVDPTVNFDWGTSSPYPTIAADQFSVRWTGLVFADFAEMYTFYVGSDEGARLWVDGNPVIDMWFDHGFTEYSGQIPLGQGWHPIRLDYYENTGDAAATLSYGAPSVPKQVIPNDHMDPLWGEPGHLPPVISGVSASPGQTQCTISWTTNVPATSQVEYGLTSSYGFSTAPDYRLLASHSVTVSGLAPDTLYHYRARSRDQYGFETVSEDQTFATQSGPDLQVTSITAPAEAWTDISFDVSWTVANNGAPASGSWVDRVYLSEDGQAGGDRLLGEYSYAAGLATGASVERTQSVTIGRDGIIDGHEYYVVVVTDAANSIAEGAGEANNTLVDDQPLQVQVVPLPDLTVGLVDAPPFAQSGQTIQATWQVCNDGAGSTGFAFWYDRVYLSTTHDKSGVIKDYGLFINESYLDPSQCYSTPPHTFTVPTGISGPHYLVVETDNGNYLLESGESNNVGASAAIQVELVPAGFLHVESVIVSPAPPVSVWGGDQVQVTWTVRNTGSSTIAASSWSDGKWDDGLALSPTPSWDGVNGYWIGGHQAYHYGPLAVDESYTQNKTITIPAGISAGTWYVVAVPDCHYMAGGNPWPNNDIPRDQGGAPVQVEAPNPGDLEITAVNAPGSALSGESVDVSWTVRNFGPGAINQTQWTDRVYLSADNTLDVASDTLLTSTTHYGALGLDATYPGTARVTVPNGLSGNYYIIVLTDGANQVPEFDEANNWRPCTPPVAVTLRLTDLVVSSVDAPSAGNAGQPVTVSWTVTNAGTHATTETSWSDRLYLSTDTVLDTASDTPFGTFSHSGALGAGQSYTQTQPAVLPQAAPGAYYVFAKTDYDNRVYEQAAEDNNAAYDAGQIAVGSALIPDLQVSRVDAPDSGASGQAIEVSWTVTNAGAGSTGSTQWTDAVYLSQDETLDVSADTLLGTFSHVGALSPGGSYSLTDSVSLPNGIAGGYYVFVLTDSGNAVSEGTLENNNSGHDTAPVQIALTPWPDLTVPVVDAPSSCNFGEMLALAWTVRNSGIGPTPDNPWTDAIYLSRDEILDLSDTLLGTVERVGVLDAGAEYVGSAQVPVPTGIEGPYYVFVAADQADRVYEYGHEDNNVGHDSTPVQITIPALPDLRVGQVTAAHAGQSGQPLAVEWTVMNAGGAPTAVAAWYDAVYLSKDQTLDQTDPKVGYLAHSGALAAGGSYPASMQAVVPSNASAQYYVFVLADSTNTVHEYNNEGNNSGFDPVRTLITVTPPADLIVTDIQIPDTGTPGQPATIAFTVTNQGSSPAAGPWTDSVYLSADETWDIDDKLVGRVDHAGTLAPSDSYVGSLTAPLPPVNPGGYYVIVRSDVRNRVPESNESNNSRVSAATMFVDVAELTLGVPYSSQLSTGTEHYYKVNVPEGEDLLITLDCESETAATELYVRYGAMPDRGHYDFVYDKPLEPDQEITVPTAQAGWYYVLVRGDNVPEASVAYSVQVDTMPHGIRKINPTLVGNGGTVTFTVAGFGFSSATEFVLVASDGSEWPSIDTTLADAATAYVTFDLTSVPVGTAEIQELDSAAAASRAAPSGPMGLTGPQLQVMQGGASALSVQILGPSTLRVGVPGSYAIRLSNAGLVNTEDTLLRVSVGARTLTEALVGPIPPGGMQTTTTTVTIDEEMCVTLLATAQEEKPLPKQSCEELEATISILKKAWDNAKPELDLVLESITRNGCNCELKYTYVDPCFSLCRRKRELDRIKAGLCAACDEYRSRCGTAPPDCDECNQGLRAGTQVTRTLRSYESAGGPPLSASLQICASRPRDPNDKAGAAGFGSPRFVARGEPVPYTVNFENVSSATAPAHTIRITDRLDPNLDLRTFRLGEIVFGNQVISVPENRSYYQTRIDLGPEHGGILADISAGLDAAAGQVRWTLNAIDPATGESPQNPLLGLLPPNDENHIGEGHVTYTIKPKSGLATGTIISNSATIVFDTNEPIDTNTVTNTIDSAAPSSSVSPLPTETGNPTFTVSWSGEDDSGGSGLKDFDVYVRDNNGAWAQWQTGATATSASFAGGAGHTYSFYSVAWDYVGNVEDAPTEPDAVTTVQGLKPSNPNPPDGTAGVSPLTALSWTPGYGAAGYDLYLWEDGSTKPSAPTVAGLSASTFQPYVALDYVSRYRWQVIAKGGTQGEASGGEWTFTTREAPSEASLADAKRMGDGTWVAVQGLIVTAVFEGFFYAERPDRTAGVRIKWEGQVTPGRIVNVKGLLGTTQDCERYVRATHVGDVGSGTIAPVGIPGRAIGGSDFAFDPVTGAGQRGVKAWTWIKEGENPRVHALVDVPGLNNIGLLIRTWGKVVHADADCFYLDDGSGYDHGDPLIPGVRVALPPGTTAPALDSCASVTGISSCYRSGGIIYRLLRARSATDIDWSNYTGAMAYIPAGTFLMGNSGDGWHTNPDHEYPQHTVYVSAFRMGKHEVTRGEYRRFINAGGYSQPAYWSSDGWSWKLQNNRTEPTYWTPQQDWGHGAFEQTESHPVVGVSYYEAEAFCHWAGGHLPTEAQWEKAARWTDSHPNVYPWGDTWDPENCNNDEDQNPAGGGYAQTSPVGSYPLGASPYGCQDMAGNVLEWCTDWHAADYYSQTPAGGWSDPQGPSSGTNRSCRGGCSAWPGEATCRCAFRHSFVPGFTWFNLGFRLAR